MSKSKDVANFLLSEIFGIMYLNENDRPDDDKVIEACVNIAEGIKSKIKKPKKILFWDKVIRHLK